LPGYSSRLVGCKDKMGFAFSPFFSFLSNCTSVPGAFVALHLPSVLKHDAFSMFRIAVKAVRSVCVCVCVCVCSMCAVVSFHFSAVLVSSSLGEHWN
jgi:hypothetical protein